MVIFHQQQLGRNVTFMRTSISRSYPSQWGLWGEELWLSLEVSVLGVEYQGIVDTERRAWARRDGHWY